MQLSLAEAGRTDDVTQTVNYAEVNELIAQRVKQSLVRFNRRFSECYF